jgi:hypothetical protein
MPYKLRKSRGKDLYWVVGEDGKKHSKDPIPRETAEKQMKALYIAMGKKEDGVTISKPAFIKEHTSLVKVLKKGKKSELLKEAKDQSAELSKVMSGGMIRNAIPDYKGEAFVETLPNVFQSRTAHTKYMQQKAKDEAALTPQMYFPNTSVQSVTLPVYEPTQPKGMMFRRQDRIAKKGKGLTFSRPRTQPTVLRPSGAPPRPSETPEQRQARLLREDTERIEGIERIRRAREQREMREQPQPSVVAYQRSIASRGAEPSRVYVDDDIPAENPTASTEPVILKPSDAKPSKRAVARDYSVFDNPLNKSEAERRAEISTYLRRGKGKLRGGFDVWDVVNPLKDVVDTFIPGSGFLVDLIRDWLDAPKKAADEFRARSLDRAERLKNLSPEGWNEIYKQVLGDNWKELMYDDINLAGKIYGAVVKQAEDETYEDLARVGKDNTLLKGQYEFETARRGRIAENTRKEAEIRNAKEKARADAKGISVEELRAQDLAEKEAKTGSVEWLIRRRKKARQLGITEEQVDEMDEKEAIAKEAQNPTKFDPVQLEAERQKIINSRQLNIGQKEAGLFLLGVPPALMKQKTRELREIQKQRKIVRERELAEVQQGVPEAQKEQKRREWYEKDKKQREAALKDIQQKSVTTQSLQTDKAVSAQQQSAVNQSLQNAGVMGAGLVTRMNAMLPHLFGGMKQRFYEDIEDIKTDLYGSGESTLVKSSPTMKVYKKGDTVEVHLRGKGYTSKGCSHSVGGAILDAFLNVGSLRGGIEQKKFFQNAKSVGKEVGNSEAKGTRTAWNSLKASVLGELNTEQNKHRPQIRALFDSIIDKGGKIDQHFAQSNRPFEISDEDWIQLQDLLGFY